MPVSFVKRFTLFFLLPVLISISSAAPAQENLLLNGNFEDINTCTEYNSECGVEAWFYMQEVKVQMLSGDTTTQLLGNNSLAVFYNWNKYAGFSPVIGTILPCRLQKNKAYTFKGILSLKLNNKLIFKPGVAMGEKFYVPKRPFSVTMHPDTLVNITPVPKTNFYAFEYNFIATGSERYLTFGSFIEEDTLNGKKMLLGTQVVSLVLDNFQLIPADKEEGYCADYAKNKKLIYDYNYRHKEMDYSLFGKGELAINFNSADSNLITLEVIRPIPKPVKADTLKLGDVFFDFNKAELKPAALKMLKTFFSQADQQQPIDSIYIEGHTDSIGTDAHNVQLSLQRCESIKTWLQQNHPLMPDKIHVRGFGETRPIASNNTSKGRALNRRVELIIFRSDKE
jgi:outer membrane protein OmpA-like peptidoglycan-associated protein